MGNYVTSLATPSLLTIEEYLSDLSHLEFDEELVGSRLFKVAKAKHHVNGSRQAIVLKVFPCSNAKDLLSAYRTVISAYCSQLVGNHLLSFSVQVSASERSVLILRDFIDQSLVDRLCTRPFLSMEEKRWIAFQLLQALSQLHSSTLNGKQSVLCHGDIKAENVLLTSWGWLLLSDPAPFKPNWLPVDNPSEFTHYFDSSRKRACYLAPERFVDYPNVAQLSPQVATESDDSAKSAPVLVCSDPDSDFVNETDDTAEDKERSNNIADETLPRSDQPPKSSPPSKHTLPPNPGDEVQAKQTVPSLTPSMDLFSAGCVLLELLTDGSVAFTLADLLAYRNGNSDRLNKLLQSIPCEHLRAMVENLISRDGTVRLSAEAHLDLQRGKAFPNLFYSHLRNYMQTFLQTHLKNPTVRIAYIRRTVPKILEELRGCSSADLSTCAVLLCNLVTSVLKPTGPTFVTQTPNTMTTGDGVDSVKLPVDLVEFFTSQPEFSDTRLLERGKIDVLICYLELYVHLPAPLVLERIVPYCVELTSSVHSAEVRCLAIETLAQMLQDVTSAPMPFVEFSFLTEYLFPSLALLSVDSREEVRLTYARCLSSLTESAMRFIESSSTFFPQPIEITDESPVVPNPSLSELSVQAPPVFLDPGGFCMRNSFLAILRSHVQERLTDLDKAARHALTHPDGLAKLAAFFGRTHASGTLLPHLITFVNVKNDPGLRTSFYRQVVQLVGLIGAQAISLVRPLLDEGLVDANEMVIEQCLHSLAQLLKHRLLSSPLAVSFLTRCLPLTSHPSNRIRQSAVGFIATFARQANIQKGVATEKADANQPTNTGDCHLIWTPSSVHARLASTTTLKTFFRRPVRNSFTHDAVLISALRRPVNRNILDALISLIANPPFIMSSSPIKYGDSLFDDFFQILSERDGLRTITRDSPCYTAAPNDLVTEILRRLQVLGLNERIESQLLHLKTNIYNMCEAARERMRLEHSYAISKHTCPAPTGRIRTLGATHKAHLVNRSDLPWRSEDSITCLSQIVWSLRSGICQYEDFVRNAFLAGSVPFGCDLKGDIARGLAFDPSSPGMQPSSTTVTPNISTDATSSGLASTQLSGRVTTLTGSEIPRITRNFPQGKQIAHLHEHPAGYLSLAVHMSGRLMASCSSGDGCVKLWNFGSWPVDLDAHLANPTNSTQTPSEHPSSKVVGSRTAGFMQKHAIPTRSSWSYHAVSPGEKPKRCRGLLWTAHGTNLATVVGNRWLHLIDVPSGRRCGLADLLERDSGHVVSLTGSSVTQYPAVLNLGWSGLMSNGDANIVAYSTTENRICGRDIRVSPNKRPAWVMEQDKCTGLIRCLALHSCHTWIVAGTSRGYLTCWDLRYRRPAASAHLHSKLEPNVQLSLTEIDPERSRSQDHHSAAGSKRRTMVVAATDHNHEVNVWDLELTASSSFAQRFGTAKPQADNNGLMATFETSTASYTPVRSTICLPPSEFPCAKPLPNVVTGDKDGRIRSLDFSNHTYRIASFGESDTNLPVVTYNDKCINGVIHVYETEHRVPENKSGKSSTQTSGLLVAKRWEGHEGTKQPTESPTSKADTFPAEGTLDIREPTCGHANVISDISLLHASHYFLVTAAMDGVIKVWQ